MKINRRISVVFQRSPLPIHSGADQRVSEMLDALATRYEFVSLLVLSYITSETRKFCCQRNIAIHSVIPTNGLYSWLNYIKRAIDASFHKLPLLNPLRLLRIMGVNLMFLQRKAGKPDDPYWSLCCDPVALKIAKFVHKHRIDAIIAEYIWLTGCVRHLPHGVLKLIDTHDVIHLRKSTFAEQFIANPEFGLVGREEECAALAHFDCIIAIQALESNIFRQMLPGKQVITVPSGGNIALFDKNELVTMSSRDVAARERVKEVDGKRFLFLGGSHTGNVLALKHLIEHIWPQVLRTPETSYASLIIAGDIGQTLHSESLDLPNILVLGYVDRTDWLYDAVDIVLNPTFSGSGLKIKSVDALARKKLVITTPSGIEGIVPPVDNCCLIAHTPEQFADLMQSFLTGQIDTHHILESLATYVERYLSSTAQYRELFKILDKSLPPKKKIERQVTFRII